MLRKRLEYILKHNIFIQILYKQIFSFLLRVVGYFISQNENLILFSSFGGKKYNDSPRVLFEALRDDPRFAEFRFVWAFEEPKKFSIVGAECIRIDTWTYFKTALQARVWITSVNIERGLHFKKKRTIYVNTWHGAGTKKIGNACSGRRDYDFSNVDMMLVQSEFEREIFLRDFLCNPAAIRKVGFPRNDELFFIDDEKRREFRKKLSIPDEKKVILYAPTWRDSKDGGLSYEFIPPLHLNKWHEQFAKKFIMLFRMHAFTTNFEMGYDSFARDVSQYDNLNHIIAISDVIITDYSTIVYDCAIAGKPFCCFGFDYDTYKNERGFYFDLNEIYPGGVLREENAVIQRVIALSQGADAEKFRKFRDKYIEAGGQATQRVIEELSAILKRNPI